MKENQIVLPPDAKGGVSITPPQGCEVDKVEVVDGVLAVTFKPKERKLPKTWEEFCEMYPIKKEECYINSISCILARGGGERLDADINVLPDRATAEAVLALCQLIQLRDCYNQGWKPDWKDNEDKNVIEFCDDECYETTSARIGSILYFKTNELRDEFLKYFQPLIEKIKPLFGIQLESQ